MLVEKPTGATQNNACIGQLQAYRERLRTIRLPSFNTTWSHYYLVGVFLYSTSFYQRLLVSMNGVCTAPNIHTTVANINSEISSLKLS